MAYNRRGLGSRRRASAARKNAKRSASRRYNRPVLRKLRAPSTSRRNPRKRNTAAIRTLANQVTSLRQRDKGSYRTAVHYMFGTYLSNFNVDNPGILYPSVFKFPKHGEACCFNVNDFRIGALLTHGYVEGQAPYECQTLSAGNGGLCQWRSPSNQNYLAAYQDWNRLRALNKCSVQEYWPLHSKFTFDVTWTSRNTSQVPAPGPEGFRPWWMRVTIFKLKKNYKVSSSKNYRLPHNIGAYGRLCTGSFTGAEYYQSDFVPTDAQEAKTRFNPEFHTIIADRYVKMNHPNQAGDYIENTTDVYTKRISLSYAHPNRCIRLEKQIQQTVDVTKYNGIEDFTDLDTQVWCMFTTSLPRGLAAQIDPKCKITRVISWRDNGDTPASDGAV